MFEIRNVLCQWLQKCIVSLAPWTLCLAADCQVGEMHCDRGTRCVKASWVCDGYRDCEDNTDEKDCGG